MTAEFIRPCHVCGDTPQAPTCFKSDGGAVPEHGWVQCLCGVRGPVVSTGFFALNVWSETARLAWNGEVS